MECQFCGETTAYGSNEFGEFACVRCLSEVANMMPPEDMLV